MENKVEEPDNTIGSLPADNTGQGIKWTGYILRLLVCAAVLYAGYEVAVYYWNQKREPGQKKQEELVKRLVAIPVKSQEVTLKISGYGRARALADILISAEVNGRITYLNPKMNEGDLVKKGEILCKIDKRDYENSVNQNLTEIKKLQNQYKVKEQVINDVKKEFDAIKEIFTVEIKRFARTKNLFDKKVVSRDTYENALQEKATRLKQKIVVESLLAKAKLELDTINADIVKAQTYVKLAQDNLKRCEIICPFLARVNEVFIDAGEYVTKGNPMFEIANETRLEIPVSLNAVKAAKILGLMDQKSKIPNYSHWLTTPGRVPIHIEWTQAPKKCCFDGKLTRIEKFSPDTGTIVIDVEPLKKDRSSSIFPIVTGMFCKVTLSGQTLKNAFLISKVALQLDDNLYIINKSGRLQARKVKISGSEGDKMIVTSGIKAGDLVIIQRLPRGMISGMKVKPISPDMLSLKKKHETKNLAEKIETEKTTSKPTQK